MGQWRRHRPRGRRRHPDEVEDHEGAASHRRAQHDRARARGGGGAAPRPPAVAVVGNQREQVGRIQELLPDAVLAVQETQRGSGLAYVWPGRHGPRPVGDGAGGGRGDTRSSRRRCRLRRGPRCGRTGGEHPVRCGGRVSTGTAGCCATTRWGDRHRGAEGRPPSRRGGR